MSYQQIRMHSDTYRVHVSRIGKIVTSSQPDRLCLVPYKQGGASYLQVLSNETNYFAAEFNLVQALGGG